MKRIYGVIIFSFICTSFAASAMRTPELDRRADMIFKNIIEIDQKIWEDIENQAHFSETQLKLYDMSLAFMRMYHKQDLHGKHVANSISKIEIQWKALLNKAEHAQGMSEVARENLLNLARSIIQKCEELQRSFDSEKLIAMAEEIDAAWKSCGDTTPLSPAMLDLYRTLKKIVRRHDAIYVDYFGLDERYSASSFDDIPADIEKLESIYAAVEQHFPYPEFKSALNELIPMKDGIIMLKEFNEHIIPACWVLWIEIFNKPDAQKVIETLFIQTQKQEELS